METTKIKIFHRKRKKNISTLNGEMFTKMAAGGAAELRANADTVNNLNVFPVPDGDTGYNMCMTIESGVAALKDVDSSSLETVMATLAGGMLMGARGNSGVILSQFFSGMSQGFHGCTEADVRTIGNALMLGVKKAYASVLTPTEGTILTVAREAVDYAVKNINEDSTVNSLFADLVKEAYESLRRTPELLSVLKEANVVDSGGAGLLYIVEGFNKALNGKKIANAKAPEAEHNTAIDLSLFNADTPMPLGYCTEVLLQLQNEKVDAEAFDPATITEFLQTIGNSIVSFKTGTIIKIHVHTHEPEKVLAFCRQFGEFLTVKIENMSVQHNENIHDDTEPKHAEKEIPEPSAAGADEPTKKYGMVAVSSGEGLVNVLKELGVDQVVSGGQTNNPSTSDFIEAFNKVPAEHIFVFPNNGNIILTAKQAAEIYTAKKIHVIESRDFGAGYAGVIAFDGDAESAEKLAEQMTNAMRQVTTGYVSPAVRDAELNGVKIKNGDYIGYAGKAIITSEADKNVAARKLVKDMLTKKHSYVVTVFYGEDVSENEFAELNSQLEGEYPDVEFCFADGGQSIYNYIVVAE